eukprot:298984-Hanusia_phi.AAC.1
MARCERCKEPGKRTEGKGNGRLRMGKRGEKRRGEMIERRIEEVGEHRIKEERRTESKKRKGGAW